jgi:5-(carboxyamino)imidazole ribonucleotide mutase
MPGGGRYPSAEAWARVRFASNTKENNMKKIAIIMGSDSDLPVLVPAMDVLKELGIPFCVRVISAHRTPQIAVDFAKNAAKEGFGVLIAAAGKAAHLAGVLAANTLLPVIGIPVSAPSLDGLDALLSTVQMPAGVPVATVAIDGAKNAAIVAAQILAVSDEALFEKLKEQRKKQSEAVMAKDERITREYSNR